MFATLVDRPRALSLRTVLALASAGPLTACDGLEAPAPDETVAALASAAGGGGQLCTGKCAPDGVSVQAFEGGLRLVHEGVCLVTDIRGELTRTNSVDAIVIEGTATTVNVKPCPSHFSTQGDEPEIRLGQKAFLPSNLRVVAFDKDLDLTLDGVSLIADANSRALACGAGAPQLEVGKGGLTRFDAADGGDQGGSAFMTAAGGVFVDARGGSSFDALTRTISIPSTAAGDTVSLVLDAPAFQGGCQGAGDGFQGGCVTRFQGGCQGAGDGFQGGCQGAGDGFQGGCVAVEADFAATLHTLVLGEVLHVVER
ncbi:MAG: hypothetical protein IT385_14895 [Deltaproteobacteria bacterium]|nr:hypothetical protein [Deltaproteobacteria bacterium]